ncbi:DUF4234 domain-containing protein [Sessilibacter sp. MAH2]
MNGFYNTPQSELRNTSSRKSKFAEFKYISAWYIFGFNLITLGIYVMYWMYSRANLINSIHPKQINPSVISGYVVTYILLIVLPIASMMGFHSEAVEKTNLVLTIANFVLHMILLFTIRARLLEFADEEGANDFTIDPVITFFGVNIYLQYVINKRINQIFPPSQSTN